LVMALPAPDPLLSMVNHYRYTLLLTDNKY
jgi:hypothetical protein